MSTLLSSVFQENWTNTPFISGISGLFARAALARLLQKFETANVRYFFMTSVSAPPSVLNLGEGEEDSVKEEKRDR